DQLNRSIIVTRSLYQLYQHAEIIRSIAILKERGYLVKATLVGDGPEMSNLQSLSKELKIEDLVIFTGRISNDQLPELLSKASFYVAFPTTEGVSSSLFEAMAMGCFPIVSDLPANQAFLSSRKNGMLVPVDDVVALADSIEFAINNPALVAQAVATNRAFIENNVDFNKNMSRIYSQYRKTLSEKMAVECAE
ncbi:MAG: glycosyltransferase, partial [Algoriphagus sp.]